MQHLKVREERPQRCFRLCRRRRQMRTRPRAGRQANHPRGMKGSESRRSATSACPSSHTKSVRASTAPIIRAMTVGALSRVVREVRVVERGERERLQCVRAREAHGGEAGGDVQAGRRMGARIGR